MIVLNSVKVLFINGSPRKYGSCSKLMFAAEKGVIDAGGTVLDRIFLYDYDIKPCIGCLCDDESICRYPCIIKDDFNKIGEKILESHAIIFVSPIYWYNVSGVLKNFIDRMTCFEHMIFINGRSIVEGKTVGFIAVGNDAGGIQLLSNLLITMNSMGLHIPPWAIAYSHERDVLEDDQAIRDSYNVGYIVVKASRFLNSVKEWYEPNVDLDRVRKYVLDNIVKYSDQKRERDKLFNKYKLNNYK
ncbi:MAG: flavodoxin family protein [Desulfurococcaceae archaeon]